MAQPEKESVSFASPSNAPLVEAASPRIVTSDKQVVKMPTAGTESNRSVMMAAADNSNKESRAPTKSCGTACNRFEICLTLALNVFIVVGFGAVLIWISQTTKHNSTLPPSTLNPPTNVTQPTAVSRLPAFRSLLLAHDVSSGNTLYNQSTAQYRALAWLADHDLNTLNASASADTIINRYVLALVYFANGGLNWTNQSNFLSSDGICDWHDEGNVSGAFCSPWNVLQELVFDSNRLTGLIPSELQRLSGLTKLRLENNFLHGTIPTTLGQLFNLTYLGLGFNDLTGTVPTELGLLTNLHDLVLADNELTGTIPSELGRLANLSQFSVESNKLTGKISCAILSINDLSINVHGNNFTGNLTCN